MGPLCSVTDLATVTGLAAESTEVELAARRASGRFRLEAEHSVSLVTDEVLYVSGNGTTKLFLPGAPIHDISVEVYGWDTNLWAPITLGYEVDRRLGILHRPSRWPNGVENIKITWTHGFDPVPEGVADAVLEHATTLALTYAHIQQEGNGSVTMGYGATATVGVTQKWANAVNAVKLRGRA